ncbi:MAG: EutN/CcmL family microcompartment protein [Chloroflexota bacterium]|nr:EutN/CcmL family microcompartment protein [Chloroflexota bacterium]
MLLGKVVGTLVATRKEPTLDGLKFLVLKQLDIEGRETGAYCVAADAVGAGIGEVVLYATGSSARQTKLTDRRPCDAVIMAIVDTLEVGGAVKYDKTQDEFQNGAWVD